MSANNIAELAHKLEKNYNECRELLRETEKERNELMGRLDCFGIIFDQQRKSLKIAIDALEFYADKNNWVENDFECGIEISREDREESRITKTDNTYLVYWGGKTAREALEKLEGCDEKQNKKKIVYTSGS